MVRWIEIWLDIKFFSKLIMHIKNDERLSLFTGLKTCTIHSQSKSELFWEQEFQHFRLFVLFNFYQYIKFYLKIAALWKYLRPYCLQSHQWRRGEVVITTAYLLFTNSEIRFCTILNACLNLHFMQKLFYIECFSC